MTDKKNRSLPKLPHFDDDETYTKLDDNRVNVDFINYQSLYQEGQQVVGVGKVNRLSKGFYENYSLSGTYEKPKQVQRDAQSGSIGGEPYSENYVIPMPNDQSEIS